MSDELTTDWRPTATAAALKVRAAMLARAREFFAARNVLEVDTPILSAGAVTDPQIESLSTRLRGLATPYYLSTSPEFPMKRLLAAGLGDIYQIGKVFRDGERGRWHSPEFTMIEWYRLGFDDAALMGEVEDLVATLLRPHRTMAPAQRITYREVLRRHVGIDAFSDPDEQLQRAAERNGIVCEAHLERDARLDLLMGLVAGPRLGRDHPCFVCDYPASQASLARIKPGSPAVAARFELYVDGIELANGFHELANGAEQRARFTDDLALRRRRDQTEPPMDERLLEALTHGMPDCAGVALGFDRLLAVALGATGIAAGMAFPIERA